MYYRGAVAAILVFDITNEASFSKVKDWVQGMNSITYIILVSHSRMHKRSTFLKYIFC